jgi:hypothetical protein
MNLQFHVPALLPMEKNSGTYQTGSWVVTIAGLNNLVKEINLCLLREPNPDSSVVLFNAQLLYLLSYSDHKYVLEVFKETFNLLSDSITVMNDRDNKRIPLRLLFVRICLQNHVAMSRHDTQ